MTPREKAYANRAPHMLSAMTDVRMIDVGDKPVTRRRAVARAEVHKIGRAHV